MDFAPFKEQIKVFTDSQQALDYAKSIGFVVSYIPPNFQPGFKSVYHAGDVHVEIFTTIVEDPPHKVSEFEMRDGETYVEWELRTKTQQYNLYENSTPFYKWSEENDVWCHHCKSWLPETCICYSR